MFDKILNQIIRKFNEPIEKKLDNQTIYLREKLDNQTIYLRENLESLFAANDRRQNAAKSDILTALSKLFPKNGIQHLDYHLTTHCNLNCKGCSTFAPIAKEWFADPESFKNDLEALRHLIGDGVACIHLLGGEPLLHPQALDFAFIARAVFPDARIDFTTNGLLVKQMPESFWNALRRTRIAIKYTRYPIALDYDDMIRYIQSKGVEVFSAGGEIAFFRRIPMNPKGTFNMFRSYIECPYTDCAQLRGGKLYRCPASAFHDILNEKLESGQTGFKLNSRDYIDLYGNEPREHVEQFLSTAIPFCSYCDTARINARIPWSQSEKKVEEWVDF